MGRGESAAQAGLAAKKGNTAKSAEEARHAELMGAVNAKGGNDKLNDQIVAKPTNAQPE